MSSGKPALYSLLILLSAINFHACGYRLVGQGTGLPDEIAKISVEVLKNKTYEPNLEAYVTKGILDAITIDGRLKVVPSDQADAVITGEITSYSILATAYNSARTASSYKNSMSVTFKVTDRHGMDIEYDGSVSATGSYSTKGSLQSSEASRLTSLVSIGKSVGISITNTLLNRFSLEPLLYGETHGLTMADKNRLKHLYSWRPAGKEIFGNISSLKGDARSEIETLYLEHSDPSTPVSKKLLYRLVDYSEKLGKDIALLENRSGQITHVIVDSDTLPDFRPMEIGKNRLSGMKLIRSNLSRAKLTKRDLENLQSHRLDMVITVNGGENKPGEESDRLEIRLAHLTGDEKAPFIIYGPEHYNNAVGIYNGFKRKEAGTINALVYGETEGLPQKHIKLAQSLYTERAAVLKEKTKDEIPVAETKPKIETPPKRRSIPAKRIVTETLMEDLLNISKRVKRPVGILINSRGIVTDVIVNQKNKVLIPETRSIESKNLQGFRFIYTNGNNSRITEGDLKTLDKHQLNFVCVASRDKKGELKLSAAFQTKDEGGPHAVYDPASPQQTDKLISKLKTDRKKETPTRKPTNKKLLEYLAQISGELNREIAILVTTSGRVTHVVVGGRNHIQPPALPKTRTGLLKLNGYNFIRTGFDGKGISGDDLEALIGTRFNNVLVAEVSKEKTLGSVSLAHLTTSNLKSQEGPFAVYGPGKFKDVFEAYQKRANEIYKRSINLSLKGATFGIEEKEKTALQSLYYNSLPEGIIGSEEILIPRKIGQNEFASEKLLADLVNVSNAIKKETGILINRDGEIEAVVVGDEMQILYPPPSAKKLGKRKLSGLRFIHTQFGKGGISESGDLYDLQTNRFDMMAVVTIDANGIAGNIGTASLTGDENRPFAVHDPITLSEANKIYSEFAESVKDEPETTPLYGDSSGIFPDDLESLQNLYFEKIDTAKPLSGRLQLITSQLSNKIEQGIGIIFNRDGIVSHVLLGGKAEEKSDVKIPPLPYRRIGKLKLNGSTLIHFNPHKSRVSKNDLAELNFQRLDAVITVEVKPKGAPKRASLAHLTNNRQRPLATTRASTPDKINRQYRDFIRQQSN